MVLAPPLGKHLNPPVVRREVPLVQPVGARRRAGRKAAKRPPTRPTAHLAACLSLALAGSAEAASRFVIAAGLGGEAEYETAFVAQADEAAQAAETLGAGVTLLLGGEATGAAIRGALAAPSGAADEVLVLLLVGHGSYDGEHYRFNVPGPDPTAEDLSAWLAGSGAARQLVVLATSASGAALDVLQQEERAVIAATKDGRERNAVVFGQHWVAALAAARADIDKDGRIDADEAFRYAEQAVAEHYERAGRIATEHPRVAGDATTFTLAALADGRGFGRTGPDAERRAALLDQIDALRASKADHAEEDYFSALQELLLELSALERALEES